MSFARYSPGGREFWLEAFGGRHFTVDRKGLKAPLFIELKGVTVLGGIQPEKLSECLLKTADDGLVARFLWAWPDPVRYQRPSALADVTVLERVYRRLLSLRPGRAFGGEACPVVLMLDDNAAAIFEEWIRDNDAFICEAAGLYEGFSANSAGWFCGLLLLLSCSRGRQRTVGNRPLCGPKLWFPFSASSKIMRSHQRFACSGMRLCPPVSAMPPHSGNTS